MTQRQFDRGLFSLGIIFHYFDLCIVIYRKVEALDE